MPFVPDCPEDIDPPWLTDALATRHPGVEVEAIEIADRAEVTNSHAWLRVSYAAGSASGPDRSFASSCLEILRVVVRSRRRRWGFVRRSSMSRSLLMSRFEYLRHTRSDTRRTRVAHSFCSSKISPSRDVRFRLVLKARHRMPQRRHWKNSPPCMHISKMARRGVNRRDGSRSQIQRANMDLCA